MSVPITITITNAGRAAMVNAQHTGTASVAIAAIGLSATAVTPDPAATSLPGEFKRVATVGGQMVAADMIHVTMTDSSGDAYSALSFAIYLADGTLFALYGQASAILTKTAATLGLLAVDIELADSSAATISFGDTSFLNPPASETVQGVVELATLAEAQAGIDALRALTPAGALASIIGWLQGKDVRLGVVDAQTPNVGTKGGVCLRLNPASGFGYFQITNADASAQFGLWQFDAAGNAGWNAAGRLLHNGTTVWSGQTDGAGSGMDADLWRGQTPGQLLTSAQDTQFGIMRARTPENAGTNGGVVLSVRDSDGIGLLQITNAALNAQYGLLSFNRAGLASWDGTWNAVNVQVGGNSVWHAANDGAGSGLDADLWRGQTPLQLLASGYDATFGMLRGRTPENAGDTGGLVLGVRDSDGIGIFQVTNAAMNQQYGVLSFNRAGLANWNGTWNAANVQVGGNNVWHTANDGAGSGLDADLWRGQTPGDFLASGYDATFGMLRGRTPENAGDTGGLVLGVRDSDGIGIFQVTNAAMNQQYGVLSFNRAGLANWNGTWNAANVQVGGNSVWHTANDGAGSGLDADLWRGQTPEQLLMSGLETSFGITRAQSPENAGSTGAYVLGVRDSDGVGIFQITDRLHQNQYGVLSFDRSGLANWSGTFRAADVQVGGNSVWHPGNDGAGSGLDADLWRGLTPAQWLAQNFPSGGDMNNGFWRYEPDGNGGAWLRIWGKATTGYGYGDGASGWSGTYTLPKAFADPDNVACRASPADINVTGIDSDLVVAQILDANHFRLGSEDQVRTVYYEFYGKAA